MKTNDSYTSSDTPTTKNIIGRRGPTDTVPHMSDLDRKMTEAIEDRVGKATSPISGYNGPNLRNPWER
jgi:hypothetical protein